MDASIRWKGKVNEVIIENVKIGGQNSLPFLRIDGNVNKPVIGLELSENIEETKTVFNNLNPDIVLLSPTNKENLEKMLDFLNVPIILSFQPEDKDLMEKCAKLAYEKKKKIIISCARQEDYKTVAALCLTYGHYIIAQSPMDTNMAKQLNILLSEIGIKNDRIIMDPLSSSIGYGLEYVYSTVEKIRLNALEGDEFMQQPIICFASKVWETREAGEDYKLGVEWEVATGLSMLISGCDMLIVKNPEAFKRIKTFVDKMS